MADDRPKTKLPIASDATSFPRQGKAAKTKAGGWAAFTDAGTAPGWVIAARLVMVLAFAATIPTVLGVKHGNRLIWTICIASLPFFWMAFGYHLWRRICPLAVMGQIGRLVGKPGTRKMSDWMSKNYLLVQLGLMVVCLSLRLSGTNGSAMWLASFLGVVIVAAIVTSFVFAGKTWCNFVCPVGLVEKIHTEPARAAIGGGDLTSQCAPCVACKKHCPDIDLEQGYWKEEMERPRRIAYFAWPGIVVAFYVFYYLCSGTWDYYFSGAWAYDGAHALDEGFYFLPQLPVAVAAPLTLIAFGAVSFVIFHIVETVIHGSRLAKEKRAKAPAEVSAEDKSALEARVRHGMLAFCGLVAFNAFYLFAGQPSLQRMPGWVVSGWSLIVVFSSTAMFVRRFARREDQYVHEKFAQKILKKWEWGEAPPSDDLKDIYLLHTERTKQRESRLRAYKETVREMVADGTVTRGELVILDSLRAQLGISDKDHQKIIGELSSEDRRLFDPAYQGSVESRLAREQYRKDLERIVVEAARAGTAPSAGTLEQLRSERGVSDEDEAHHLQQILAPGGPIAALYDAEIAAIGRLAAAAEATADPAIAGLAMPPQPTSLAGIRTPQLSTKVLAAHHGGGSDSASVNLLRHLARRRAREHAVSALGVLAVMTKRPEVEHVRAQAQTSARALRPQLLDMLGGVEPALRIPLVESLQRLDRAEAAPLTAGPILAVAGDGSRHLRAAAAVLLSRFEDDASRAQMMAMIDDPEPIVREAAVRAMGAKSRLTRDVLAKVLADPEAIVRHAAVRAVSGGTTSQELPALDPAILAQTTRGVGKPGVYATLDANAAMASLTTIEKMMLIRQVPIFSDLAADDLEELAAVVEERKIDAGKDVFREGDPGDAVYLIIKGSVCVFTGGDGVRPERVLSELGTGACIGEMAVLDASPRSATVRAIERTRTLRVPGEGFKRVMTERPEMSQAIVAELVKRMRGMMSQGPTPSMSNPAIPIPKPDD